LFKPPLRSLWIPAFAGMTLLIASCGFQLRGDPAVGFKTLFVPGAGVAQEIRRTLVNGPTRVVSTAAEGEANLRILSETRDKQVYTITGTGQVYEFELKLIVRYDMMLPGHEEPAGPSTEITARRTITYSAAAPIAKEAEELLLFKDMQVELADRILRQVAIARRKAL
jgi:LPS-assembly lipoprotein